MPILINKDNITLVENISKETQERINWIKKHNNLTLNQIIEYSVVNYKANLFIKKKKGTKPFIIRRNLKKFQAGLYRFFRGKIKMLQRFDSKGKEQPKKFDWMGEARHDYFAKHPVRETWRKNIKHVLKLK